MENLPSTVEMYLKEARFSGTEAIILKQLLDGQPVTLRELANKTSKSTGVLDQAMKKLIQRGIVVRTVINETPRFTIPSTQVVMEWVRKDMQERRQMLDRKEQDFESFIASLKKESGRPEIQYFDGEDGIKKAYCKIVDCADKEMLHYLPIHTKEEEDPLRDFFVQFFRMRRAKGILSRVIAHDDWMGRRYQSRDAFEYRKTVLIPESQLKLNFEKIIAGDTVACFNHEEKRACFLHFPELADTERQLFENVWARVQEKSASPVEESFHVSTPEKTEVPLYTRTVSAARSFFLSRSSLITFLIFGVVAGAFTYGLYRHTVNLNLERVRERVTAIAATAAPEFSNEELSTLRSEADVSSETYKRVITKLNEVRERNENIIYVYLLRESNGSASMEFIADADGIYSGMNKDTNGDGLVDDADTIGIPGMPLTTEIDVLKNHLYTKPIANREPYTDQWGTFITGYAPVFDQQQKIQGILAVDMTIETVYRITTESFRPLLIFFGLFIFFLFARFSALNRTIIADILRIVRLKSVIYLAFVCSIIALILTLVMYRYTLNLIKEELGNRLMSIVATAAPEINPNDLNNLHFAIDMHSEEYQRVFKKLNAIRDQNADIQFVYIFRRAADSAGLEFVADADSNYYLPLPDDPNPIEVVAPGTSYEYDYNIDFIHPQVDPQFVVDKWGTYISATAPIFENGNGIALLGVDMDVSDLYKHHADKFLPWLWFFSIFSLVLFVRLLLPYIR